MVCLFRTYTERISEIKDFLVNTPPSRDQLEKAVYEILELCERHDDAEDYAYIPVNHVIIELREHLGIDD